ncbi:ribonuclease H-like domain-containing protein [Jimgerdemannia flammicorona]|uniref:Ribonuclease H-like domain-containing protein n=1 Tax=Jimgerdemannia flammicorona TaxID=994334 RepID=A0A433A1F2_9FUNG|nr:ribonuclease H-like domain-containing protein [Jimgerdemannia flammicorona]
MADVYQEFNNVCTQHKIPRWGAKEVVRKYAFEVPGIPSESDYLKVVYSFAAPPLPNNLTGATFSHIFGANTNALELFLIKRDIMGPCWLEIKDAKISDKNISWCKVEIVVNEPKKVNPFKDGDPSAPKGVPPLVAMSLSMRTVMNHQKRANEIVMASVVVFNQAQGDLHGHSAARRRSLPRGPVRHIEKPVNPRRGAEERTSAVELFNGWVLFSGAAQFGRFH